MHVHIKTYYYTMLSSFLQAENFAKQGVFSNSNKNYIFSSVILNFHQQQYYDSLHWSSLLLPCSWRHKDMCSMNWESSGVKYTGNYLYYYQQLLITVTLVERKLSNRWTEDYAGKWIMIYFLIDNLPLTAFEYNLFFIVFLMLRTMGYFKSLCETALQHYIFMF